MFFFKNKKSPTQANFSFLGVDMHSHLLPGIDDGAPDLETSLELIRSLRDLGFHTLITTPHIMGDMYPNTPAIILDRLSVVQQAMKEQGIGIKVAAAAEYFLDDQMEKRIQSQEPLLALPGKRVLCEFSMLTPTMGVKEMLFELQMQGYQPIIAHPERYGYLQSNKGFYEELKDMGCWFQLNLLSLTPHYGRTVSDLATYLIRQGFYELVGTDLHNQRHAELLGDKKIQTALELVMGSCTIRNAEMVD